VWKCPKLYLTDYTFYSNCSVKTEILVIIPRIFTFEQIIICILKSHFSIKSLYTPRNLKLFVTPLYNPNNLKFHFEFDTELILLISKFLLIQKNIMKKGKTSELSKKKRVRDCIIFSLYKTNDLSETEKWKTKKRLIYVRRILCLQYGSN